MTSFTTLDWNAGCRAGWGWDDAARLWNASVVDRHAFFPWSGAALARRMERSIRFDPALVRWIADDDGAPVGFAHGVFLAHAFHPSVYAIEAFWIRPDRHGLGAGGQLLDALLDALEADHRRRRLAPTIVDALGAWPNGPLYATLADGSERSGIFHEREPALAALFASRGFLPVRDSVVMRQTPALAAPDPGLDPHGQPCQIRVALRLPDADYLDETFHGWHLRDHQLCDHKGYPLSRSIFARMDGLSDHTGVEHYALFGVNTPDSLQRGGWATRNIRLTLAEIARRGGRVVELHCHADNVPALGLYAKVGFTPVAHTRALHRRIPRR